MPLQHVLLVLPIHRRTYKAYYAAHDQYVTKEKAELGKQWAALGVTLESLDRNAQFQWEEHWFWPPWYFNDIIGFLEIGSDGGRCLVGEIFLKRKYFPRSSRERAFRNYQTTLQKHEILYYWEIPKREVDMADNKTYVQAALKICSQARAVVRKRVRSAEVWLPPSDLSCVNMAEADRQGREREQRPACR